MSVVQELHSTIELPQFKPTSNTAWQIKSTATTSATLNINQGNLSTSFQFIYEKVYFINDF